jgi:hypothetical protein
MRINLATFGQDLLKILSVGLVAAQASEPVVDLTQPGIAQIYNLSVAEGVAVVNAFLGVTAPAAPAATATATAAPAATVTVEPAAPAASTETASADPAASPAESSTATIASADVPAAAAVTTKAGAPAPHLA